MTLKIFAPLVAVLAVTVSLAAAENNSRTKSATGVVTSVSDGSLIIEAGGGVSLTFAVQNTTHVLKRGATSKTRERKAAGAPGLVIGDVVRPGDHVTVRYEQANGTFRAAEVRVASR
jgi:hypothetical protein